MKYTIKNVIISGGELIGYELLDENNQLKRVKTDIAVQAVLKGMIDASIATDENGVDHLTLDNADITEIAKENTNYTVTSRIISRNKLVGYMCTVDSGKEIKVEPARLWEYAAMGCVTNVEAKIINDKLTLIGKEQSLSELPIIKT